MIWFKPCLDYYYYLYPYTTYIGSIIVIHICGTKYTIIIYLSIYLYIYILSGLSYNYAFFDMLLVCVNVNVNVDVDVDVDVDVVWLLFILQLPTLFLPLYIVVWLYY